WIRSFLALSPLTCRTKVIFAVFELRKTINQVMFGKIVIVPKLSGESLRCHNHDFVEKALDIRQTGEEATISGMEIVYKLDSRYPIRRSSPSRFHSELSRTEKTLETLFLALKVVSVTILALDTTGVVSKDLDFDRPTENLVLELLE
ncbi:hypothetical protein Tco_1340815, partial [Tanacetum coccineum]